MDDSKLRKENNGFISGVFVLGLSAIVVKIIGLVYKIPMLRLLGSEGMGYFNSAYEIYAMLCTISTAGLPVAMSVMISSSRSKDMSNVGRIFSVSMRLFLIVGIIGSAVLFAFADPISAFLKSEKATYSIAAISPTVFFICLSSAYRGYFQGFGKMAPTAISQVIEAALKLILGLLFATVALSSGMKTETVAAFAVLGLVAGTAISALYLAFVKKLGTRENCELPSSAPNERILPGLMKIAIPVTLSSAVMSVTKIVDMSAILRRLQSIGYSSSEAFSAYGSYTTLALPLFSLAPALISSVSMPLVPSLSSAISKGDREEQISVVSRALSLTMLLSCPVSLGLTLYSSEILNIIFAGETEAVSVAAPLLSILGASVPLSCLIGVGNAILQAYSKAHVPIISMVFGAGVKIVLAYLLIGNRQIGIVGAPISTFFCDLVINSVNFGVISRYLPHPPKVTDVFVKPWSAALLAIGGVRALYCVTERGLGEHAWLTLAAVALSALLYAITVLLTGAIDKNEIKAFLRPARKANI